MKKTPRQKRSNYAGQEEMCSTLWDFAAEVIALGDDQSFSDPRRFVSNGQLDAVHKAMNRIATGFGYRVLEIQ